MTKAAKELKAFVEQALVDEGVARPFEFSIAANSHQQVVFHVKGIRVKYQFPYSPSDHRSMLNSRSSVKKAIRSASRYALSGAPTQRSILDASSLLPSQPHHMGTGRAGVSKLAPSVHGRWPCAGSAYKTASRS